MSAATTPAAGGDRLGRASAVMAAGTLVSRLLGLVRTGLLVAVVGITATTTADAFEVANTLPNQLNILLAGGILNAVLVPQIVRAQSHADGGVEFVGRIVTWSLALMAVVAVVGTLAAPWLVRLYSDAGDPAAVHLTVVFAYVCIPQIFFYGLYTLLGQILNAHGRFGAYMWAPVVANVVAIAGLLAFLSSGMPRKAEPAAWTTPMVALVAGSATVSIAIQALFLIVPLRRMGFRWRPSFAAVGLGSASTIAKWSFASVAVMQLVFVYTSRVLTHANDLGKAAGVPSAGRAAYAQALLVSQLPHSLVTVSLITALYTQLSRATHTGDLPTVRRYYRAGLRTPAVLLVPGVAFVLAFSRIIASTLNPGASLAETDALAPVLAAFALQVVPLAWFYLNERVFYAHEDARTPFVIQLVMGVVTLLGSFVGSLVPFTDSAWVVALGSTVSLLVGAGIGFVLLRRLIGPVGLRALVGHYWSLVLPSAVVAIGLALLAQWLVPNLSGHRWLGLGVLVLGGAGQLGLTLLLAHRLGVREVDEVAGPVLRRLKRA